MNKQWHSCGTCGKLLSSCHSLWRHKKNCRSAPHNIPNSDIPTFNVNDDKKFTAKGQGPDRETGPRNRKIQALVNEIVNDSVSHTEPAAEVQKMPSMEPAIRTIAPPAVDLLPSTPRTKGDIIWYSDNDEPNIKVKYLTAMVDGLWKRFNKLYKEFTQMTNF